MYLDVERALKLSDEAFALANADGTNLPTIAQNWLQFRNLSKIDGLKRATLASGFDGRQWGTRVYLEAPAPRRGIVALLDQSPFHGAVSVARGHYRDVGQPLHATLRSQRLRWRASDPAGDNNGRQTGR